MNYKKETQLEVYSEFTNSKHNVIVAAICKKFEFVLLKSTSNVIKVGPHIANAMVGEKILLCGYGNNFQTISYLTGLLHLDLQLFKGKFFKYH